MVEIVAEVSSRFNKVSFQVIESKDPPKRSAPEPKTVGGCLLQSACFQRIPFQRDPGSLLNVVEHY